MKKRGKMREDSIVKKIIILLGIAIQTIGSISNSKTLILIGGILLAFGAIMLAIFKK